MRRSVAVVAAVALVAEACGLAFYNLVLGLAVRRQSMSLAGLPTRAMSSGAFAAGAVLALFVLACAAVAVWAAVTDRPPRRLARIALVVCAVFNGILGAAAVGIVGWAAFAGTMVIMGLVVLTLIMFPDEPPAARPAAEPPADGAPA